MFKAHVYIRFQFNLNSLSEAIYICGAKQNMSSCISYHLNIVRSKSNYFEEHLLMQTVHVFSKLLRKLEGIRRIPQLSLKRVIYRRSAKCISLEIRSSNSLWRWKIFLRCDKTAGRPRKMFSSL